MPLLARDHWDFIRARVFPGMMQRPGLQQFRSHRREVFAQRGCVEDPRMNQFRLRSVIETGLLTVAFSLLPPPLLSSVTEPLSP